QLMAIENAEVVDAGVQSDLARVSVRFTSEQVNVVRDVDGKEIEGDPASAQEVVDIWTFERDTRSRDPNWTLVETRTPS
ncbi:MAG: Tim44/TimA family putative adaptor protein, partial [Geminicoccaceae bacterium]